MKSKSNRAFGRMSFISNEFQDTYTCHGRGYIASGGIEKIKELFVISLKEKNYNHVLCV
jgi:hypothetical protein